MAGLSPFTLMGEMNVITGPIRLSLRQNGAHFHKQQIRRNLTLFESCLCLTNKLLQDLESCLIVSNRHSQDLEMLADKNERQNKERTLKFCSCFRFIILTWTDNSPQ